MLVLVLLMSLVGTFPESAPPGVWLGICYFLVTYKVDEDRSLMSD